MSFTHISKIGTVSCFQLSIWKANTHLKENGNRIICLCNFYKIKPLNKIGNLNSASSIQYIRQSEKSQWEILNCPFVEKKGDFLEVLSLTEMQILLLA